MSDQVVDTLFGLAEDKCFGLSSISLQLAEQFDKSDIFLLHGACEDLLFDRWVGCHFFLSNLDANRSLNVAAVLEGEGLNFLGPGGAKHECLAVGAHMPHDPL